MHQLVIKNFDNSRMHGINVKKKKTPSLRLQWWHLIDFPMELPPGINCSAQGLIPGIVWYAESLVSFWFSLICKRNLKFPLEFLKPNFSTDSSLYLRVVFSPKVYCSSCALLFKAAHCFDLRHKNCVFLWKYFRLSSVFLPFLILMTDCFKNISEVCWHNEILVYQLKFQWH